MDRTSVANRFLPPAGARIIVAGGCGGIGASIVERLHDADCEVAVLDLPESLAQRQQPPGVLEIGFDGRDERQVVRAFQELRQHWPAAHGLAVVSGYAGPLERVGNLSNAELDDIIDGNLKLTAYCCREALPLLRAAETAAVVTMSSGLGYVAQPGYASYAAAKAGVIALTRALAREEAPRIRANVLAPGGVDTAFLRGGFGRGGTESGPPLRLDLDSYRAMIPLGRMGEPEDIADPALFLLSEASGYLTGEVLHINGGALMY